MIKSMTGYASESFIINSTKFIVEIKSVNSKILDLNIKSIKNLFKLWIVKPELPPQLNEGIKFLGKPDPKIFDPTPTTVPVLNIVFIPHLEWSPIISPQNCNCVFLNELILVPPTHKPILILVYLQSFIATL